MSLVRSFIVQCNKDPVQQKDFVTQEIEQFSSWGSSKSFYHLNQMRQLVTTTYASGVVFHFYQWGSKYCIDEMLQDEPVSTTYTTRVVFHLYQ